VSLADLSPEETANRSAEALGADDRAARSLGLEWLEVGPGRARFAMTVRETMTNGHGLCHGGYIFLLADTAFAYACNSHGQRAVAQHAQVSFLAPGRLGARLTAEAIERHRGDRSGICDVSVRDESGRTIAEFRGVSRVIAGSLV
jgi:acyl-CoA thioesterase